jgi:hypothetical protein
MHKSFSTEKDIDAWLAGVKEVLMNPEHGQYSSSRGYPDAWETRPEATYLFNTKFKYRSKPREILVNGRAVPAPMTEVPALRSKVWLPSLAAFQSNNAVAVVWDGRESQMRLLKNGIVYNNEEAAVQRAHAMLMYAEYNRS